MKKTVLFIPGFKEQLDSRDYESTFRAIRGQGYEVEFVPIDWKYKTPEHWLAEFNKIYENYEAEHTVLAGFSYGAVVALMAAAQRNPAELWLFSLSPYFAEDFPLKQRWLDSIGKRRAEFFRSLSFDELVADVSCKVLAWAGSEEIDEFPGLGRRVRAIKTDIKGSRLFIIDGVGHDVADSIYIDAIAREI